MNAKLIRISQAAERLDVSQACIRRWIFRKEIAVIKIGRLVRIAESEVDRIIAEGTRPARQEGTCQR